MSYYPDRGSKLRGLANDDDGMNSSFNNFKKSLAGPSVPPAHPLPIASSPTPSNSYQTPTRIKLPLPVTDQHGLSPVPDIIDGQPKTYRVSQSEKERLQHFNANYPKVVDQRDKCEHSREICLNEKNDYIQQLQNLNDIILDKNNQLQDIDKKYNQSQSSLKNKDIEFKSLSAKYDQSILSLKDKKEEILKLQKAINSLSDNYDQSQTTITDLNQKLNTALSDNDKLHTIDQQLQTTIKDLNQKLQSVVTDNDKLQTKDQQSQSTINDLNQKLQSAVTDNDKLRTKDNQSQSAIKDINQQFQAVVNENNKLQATINDLGTQLQRKDQELQKTITEKDNNINQLQKDLDKFIKTKSIVTKQYATPSVQNGESNIDVTLFYVTNFIDQIIEGTIILPDSKIHKRPGINDIIISNQDLYEIFIKIYKDSLNSYNVFTPTKHLFINNLRNVKVQNFVFTDPKSKIGYYDQKRKTISGQSFSL